MTKTKIKKYCLLQDGSIEPCYYDKEMTELRMIYKEGRYWYLDHDVWMGFGIALCHHRILKFGDTKKELKEPLK